MKLSHRPDPVALRRAEYQRRDASALKIIFDALATLDAQGVDVGVAAKAELAVRAGIKAKYLQRITP